MVLRHCRCLNEVSVMNTLGYEIVRESIRQEGNHGYAASMGIPAFKEAIAKLYSNQHQIPIDPKNIQINHGVNMGLFAALMAISNED